MNLFSELNSSSLCNYIDLSSNCFVNHRYPVCSLLKSSVKVKDNVKYWFPVCLLTFSHLTKHSAACIIDDIQNYIRSTN